MVSVHYLLNQWIDFDQACIDTFWEEEKSTSNVGGYGLIFKVASTL